MKAITRNKYGGPEVLHVSEIEKPEPGENEILVKVKANSANPADWHILRGEPKFARLSFGLFKPKQKIIGADFAGVVEEVGSNVTSFKAGDRVYGENLEGGAFAEYICVSPEICSSFSKDILFSEMAAVPIAGLTALQALVDQGQTRSGESVLINGASGGVGHFAVQIAKELGAEVIGVCSEKSADFVKSLGADHVVAYDVENIHEHEGRYDLVIDVHGNLNFKDLKRMGSRGVVIGFTGMGHMVSVLSASALSKFSLKQFTAKPNTKDLQTLAGWMKERKVRVHIDRSYTWRDISEAIAYIEKMHTRGKVVMEWGE